MNLPDNNFTDPDLPEELLSDIRKRTLLRQSSQHSVFRVQTRDSSYVVKSFISPDSVELHMYGLLKSLDVPTLPVYARTSLTLVLEDMETSQEWRQASEADMDRAEVGRAVAAWYRTLHNAGFSFLNESGNIPPYLQPWVNEIDPVLAAAAAEKFGIAASQGWKFILRQIERLKVLYNSFPQTFNYNDFASENLALSRSSTPLEAIVFDYDYFKTGTVYSDWRNVIYSLEGAGREAFKEAYGPVNEAEGLLDEPLSTLYGLIIAARRDKFPGWARPLVEAVKNGEMERSIRLI